MTYKIFIRSLFLVGLSLFSFTHFANAAEFKAFEANERQIVTFNGRFEKGDAERFRQYLKANKQVKFVLFQSHGGLLSEAMKVGKIIKQHKLNTAVETFCYSACFVALMSGQTRYVYEDAYLGVHRPYFKRSEQRVGDVVSSRTHQKLASYFNEVLGNRTESKKIVNLMYQTPVEDMYQVSQRDQYVSVNYYSPSAL